MKEGNASPSLKVEANMPSWVVGLLPTLRMSYKTQIFIKFLGTTNWNSKNFAPESSLLWEEVGNEMCAAMTFHVSNFKQSATQQLTLVGRGCLHRIGDDLQNASCLILRLAFRLAWQSSRLPVYVNPDVAWAICSEHLLVSACTRQYTLSPFVNTFSAVSAQPDDEPTFLLYSVFNGFTPIH